MNGLLPLTDAPASAKHSIASEKWLRSRALDTLRSLMAQHVVGHDARFMPRREMISRLMEAMSIDALNALRNTPQSPQDAPQRAVETQPAVATSGNGSDAGAALAALVAPHLKLQASIDRTMVEEIVSEQIKNIPPTRIEVLNPQGEVKTMARQHYLFPLILKLAEQRIHTYLVGPAGSGKTQCVENAAKSVGLAFYAVSVCSQSTEYLLKGYMDANGNYRRSLFREAYENGGVLLIDEIDAGNPNIIACVNAALSNHVCTFPDGMVKKHENFICFAAANTYGNGSSREYVGRNPLDAATLDRFAFVDFPYDSGLEYHMAGIENEASESFALDEGGTIEARAWVLFIQVVRASLAKHGVRAVVSPRASKMGSLMLAAGIGLAHVKRMLVFKGMDKATLTKIGVQS